jgi:fumarate reductase flavoprotein subunit
MGEGMIMAAAVGGALVDMERIQIYPAVNQRDGILISESLRTDGAILINTQGRRFVDETNSSDDVATAVFEQPGSSAYVIYDQQVMDANTKARGYSEQGLSTHAASLEELAHALCIDADALRQTIETYNAITLDGVPDEFGRRDDLAVFGDGSFYACKVVPGIHYCMGGIRIDSECRVLSKDETPIPGLFAAGETTGGIHGNNRLGGNAVCDIMVNGRAAGISAAQYVCGQ